MRLRNQVILLVVLCLLTLGTATTLQAAEGRSNDGLWTLIDATELDNRAAPGLNPWLRPPRFQAVQLDPAELNLALTHAPMELTEAAEQAPLLITLPTPDGGFETFALVYSPVMAPELEAWMAGRGWPMRTYKGSSLAHPATTVRLDWGGPGGFHAAVLSPGRSYYVDPYWQGDDRLYVSYFTREYTAASKDFHCGFEGQAGADHSVASGPSTNGNLRTYRLAVAATGEYTIYHGGTVAAGQAAVVTTVNRVNQVYERDLSIRMTLVANNSLVIFTDPATDPYDNNNGYAMLGQNQSTMDTVIGNANYDMGHVVSTGGGGIASLGVPCYTGWKARGVTGSGNPIGDPFDIDYVAHEMGHQWGGNHTFNSDSGGCGGGNRNGSTAYEPGSGATIQAYAGLCGADNLQSTSDDYFHGISLDEMLSYSAGGGACSVNTSAGNPNAPVVDAGPSHNIPIGTAFELSPTSATDADGDTLTFIWEEFDLGPAATLADGDNGSSPIFRSWDPSTSSTQTFPRSGSDTATGEALPTTSRTMTFRLTARDNAAGGGRIGDDSTTVTSTTTAGPFQVTAPNGGEAWGGSETVTWNVAGTNTGLVNNATVDILLSTDGGQTFPTLLASGTPNDGSQAVTIPDVTTTSARIKVKGSGNIFFDLSDDDFLIGASAECASPALTIPTVGTVYDDLTVSSTDNIGDLDVVINANHTYVGDLTFTLTHVDTGTSVVIIDRPGYTGSGYGCSGNNIVTTLDDEAALPVEDQCAGASPTIDGTFYPNNPLAAFDGESFAGTWRLTVNDVASPDGGLLNQWCVAATPAGSADPIFSDGFESGNTSAWTAAVP